MKKLLFTIFLSVLAFTMSAQTKQFYLYNIITFEGNMKKEGLKIKIDNGHSIEKLLDANGKRMEFKTPAAALMYFEAKGWELYVSSSTTEGEMAASFGESTSTCYWILRKPCTKEELDKTVEQTIVH